MQDARPANLSSTLHHSHCGQGYKLQGFYCLSVISSDLPCKEGLSRLSTQKKDWKIKWVFTDDTVSTTILNWQFRIFSPKKYGDIYSKTSACVYIETTISLHCYEWTGPKNGVLAGYFKLTRN